MANLSIIDKLKRSKILDLLQEGKGIDDRALDEPRPLVIDTGVIPHANGRISAVQIKIPLSPISGKGLSG